MSISDFLRPSRYSVTSDGFIVLASEAGCMPLNEASIVKKGRLKPGEMLLVDFKTKQIIYDQAIKENICREYPYQNWIEKRTHFLDDRSYRIPGHKMIASSDILRKKKIAFGFSNEDEKLIISLLKADNNQPIAQLKDKSALSGKKWDAAMKGLAKHGLTKVTVDGENKTVFLN